MLLSAIIIALFLFLAVFSIKMIRTNDAGNWEAAYLSSAWIVAAQFGSVDRGPLEKLVYAATAFVSIFLYVKLCEALVNGYWKMISGANPQPTDGIQK